MSEIHVFHVFESVCHVPCPVQTQRESSEMSVLSPSSIHYVFKNIQAHFLVVLCQSNSQQHTSHVNNAMPRIYRPFFLPTTNQIPPDTPKSGASHTAGSSHTVLSILLLSSFRSSQSSTPSFIKHQVATEAGRELRDN